MSSSSSQMFAEASAASVAGFFSSFCVYPIEVIKTRLQAQGTGSTVAERDMVAVVTQIMKKEGFSTFFNGVWLGALQSSIQKFIYYYLYVALKEMYAATLQRPISPLANVALGYAAEMAHQPISQPIEVVTVRIQTAPPKTPLSTIVRKLIKEGGWYTSLGAQAVLCIKPAIQDSVYDRIKLWIAKGKALTTLQAFVTGAIARTIATLIVYPYIRAKAIRQSSNSREMEASSTPQLLLKMIRREGIFAVYRGIEAELTRGVTSAAIMLATKERLQAAVKKRLGN